MSRFDRMHAAIWRRSTLTIAGLVVMMFAIGFVAQPALSALSGTREITIVAERYEYWPSTIILKKNEPVILHLMSRDRVHGFNVKALGVRADLMPGEEIRIPVTPRKAGTFPFKCDLFCGRGHTDMSGTIVVNE